MKNLKQSTFFPVLLIIMSMTSLVTGASLAKQLFSVIGSQSTSVIRLGVAALFLMTLWRPWRFKITKPQFKLIAMYGVCLGVMNFLFYLAIARLPIGIAIAIEFTGPLSVALFLSRRPLDFIWAIFAIIGIALILPLSSVQGPIDLVGVLFALGAAAAWAFYIIQGKRVSGLTHPGAVTAIGMTCGFIAVLPFGVSHIPMVLSDKTLILTAIAVGILSSAIPYSLEMVALNRIASKHFGLLMSMEPAIGAIGGYFLLNENLTFLQYLAILFIVAASIGSTMTARNKKTDVNEVITP